LSSDYLEASDCVVVVTDHDAIDWTLVMQYAPKVIDSRNALGRLQPQRSTPAVMAVKERARLSVADHFIDPERESA
jgi:UDP-N-acetyl-D-mannosaminuronate dehydrogenase